MNLDRAYAARALAIAMPWYLDFLAVWMLNYERRRIEAMIRHMCASIEAFAKASVKPAKRDKPGAIDWGLLTTPGAFIPVTSLMDAVISAQAAKAAAQAQRAAQQNPYLNMAQNQSGLAGLSNQQFSQRRDALGDLHNMFGGF